MLGAAGWFGTIKVSNFT